jgi:hypothetical protein
MVMGQLTKNFINGPSRVLIATHDGNGDSSGSYIVTLLPGIIGTFVVLPSGRALGLYEIASVHLAEKFRLL